MAERGTRVSQSKLSVPSSSIWEKLGIGLIILLCFVILVAMIAFVVAFIFVCVWLIGLTAHATIEFLP